MYWLSILVIAVAAALIYALSMYREKRVHKYSDQFAEAFVELSDHILQGRMVTQGMALVADENGIAAPPPIDELPAPLDDIFRSGTDPYMLERFRRLHDTRDDAQLLLSSVNLIGKRYNGVMNRVYDLAEFMLSGLHDYSSIKTMEQVKEINFFVQRQELLRTTTLPTIVSREAKARLFGIEKKQ